MSRITQRACLISLGCKANQYEIQFLREKLEETGYQSVPFPQKAEVYIINTCWVTKAAESKSKKLIRQALRSSPGAFFVVTGCYAQAEKEEIRRQFPQVDLIVKNSEKLRIVELLGISSKTTNFGIRRFYQHDRAFVKVEDGCNQFCSYCCIPYVRGSQIRSRSSRSILSEIKNLVNTGFKEIVLTGINLGLYGRDLSVSEDLIGLLKKIESLPGQWRLRLSSLEPHLVPAELPEFLANSNRICPHLHLPLQSGDEEILKRMGRRYTVSRYGRLVEKFRKRTSSLAISTDVIVGFPGEEERHFNNTYHFIENMEFSRLHVFRFSSRPGTLAYQMRPRVPERITKRRSRQLKDLGEKLSQQFISRFLNHHLTVLFEQKAERETGWLSGYTENYIRVTASGEEGLKGKLIPVKLVKREGNLALGEIIQ